MNVIQVAFRKYLPKSMGSSRISCKAVRCNILIDGWFSLGLLAKQVITRRSCG